ncbi:unnamed protein product [Pieris macdunnoughi]|uniref:Uncharacterized protein n=1 Tax=Pieris macdunnoughi TaxID=345717 RepID=A0A821SRG4_9NEOP|nr:unnamed protein product [Pieris macdunnoughi]
MYSFAIRFFFICFVVNLMVSSSYGFRNRGYGNKHSKELQVNQAAPMGTGNDVSPSSPATIKRGLGISAWGLITLIISIILAMAGMYYFSICYPVLCKKPRKYDIIGSPTIA